MKALLITIALLLSTTVNAGLFTPSMPMEGNTGYIKDDLALATKLAKEYSLLILGDYCSLKVYGRKFNAATDDAGLWISNKQYHDCGYTFHCKQEYYRYINEQLENM
ncbi:hypothetical protein [Vibrio fluvialis]|uniref:hypothetical protein n=1 Tax=Vibrio fluvialis TaxID=676 RepID=UPI0028F71C9C|nr:hypothetical protein [Vibrio fluvialis]